MGVLCRKSMFYLFTITLLIASSFLLLLSSTGRPDFIDHNLPSNPKIFSVTENITGTPIISPEEHVLPACDPSKAIVKVFMYDMPPEFHFGLLDWKPEGGNVWPDIRAGIPHYPGGLNLQHSIEYWLTLDILSSRFPDRSGPCTAVRVDDSREADVVFVPFFSSLSFNRRSKVKAPARVSENKILQEKLVRYLTAARVREGAREHGFKEARLGGKGSEQAAEEPEEGPKHNLLCSGEGLQRFCTEHKIKLSKIDHVFLTRVCSETAGGLPGLLLTLAGMGENGMSVDIWGPSDLKYLIDAMRCFIPKAAMIHTHSFGVLQNDDNATNLNSKNLQFKDPIVLIDNEAVKISAFLLRPNCSRGSGDVMEENDFSDLTTLQMIRSRSHFSDPLIPCSQGVLNRANSTLKPGDVAVIYALELPEIKGKFLEEEAKKLGGVSGKKRSLLKSGESVISDDGTKMVTPSQVLEPSSPGPVVLLVDCPTPSHMLELVSLPSLKFYYADAASSRSVNCVIHLGPTYVTKSSEYQNWMKRFGNSQHIMAGHEKKNVKTPILKSSARIQSRLNYLCPQLFPALGCRSLLQTKSTNYSLGSNLENEKDSSVLYESMLAGNLLKFRLRPLKELGLDQSSVPCLFNHAETVDELLSEIPEIIDVSKHVSQLWQNPLEDTDNQGPDAFSVDIPCLDGSWKEKGNNHSDIPVCLQNVSREEMEIIFLGTGSSQPSKYRNVSAILVNLFSKGTLLLDCGEGTLAQMRRRFGLEGADDAVKSLKIIWISHIHADHHSGLARILSLRSQLLKCVPHKPLIVIGPIQLKRFLDAYCILEDLDMQFLDCRHTTEDSFDNLLGSRQSFEQCIPENVDRNTDSGKVIPDATFGLSETKSAPGSLIDAALHLPVLKRFKEVLCEAGLETLYSVPVIHCSQAFGVVLEAENRINSLGEAEPGWKLVYSGDTRPCQSLIAASCDATVLIHEATFEDSMWAEAAAKNHSTTSEALGVGTSAGAYRIILTHFSQRYPKIPVFDENHMDKACIAFDLMSVNLADLPLLPKVLPCLKVLFKNEMVTDE